MFVEAREKALRETQLPISDTITTEKIEPILDDPNVEILKPSMTHEERSDNADAILAYSNVETPLLSLVNSRTEKLEPSSSVSKIESPLHKRE
jgi:hypothetical protein